MTAFIKPVQLRAPVEGDFSIDDFEVDEEQQIVTSPNGNEKRRAVFAKNYGPPPCTESTRDRTVNSHEHHDLLHKARLFAVTDESTG